MYPIYKYFITFHILNYTFIFVLNIMSSMFLLILPPPMFYCFPMLSNTSWTFPLLIVSLVISQSSPFHPLSTPLSSSLSFLFPSPNSTSLTSLPFRSRRHSSTTRNYFPCAFLTRVISRSLSTRRSEIWIPMRRWRYSGIYVILLLLLFAINPNLNLNPNLNPNLNLNPNPTQSQT